MKLRSAAAALIVLAGTGVWAQSTEPSAPAATPAAASTAAPAPLPTPQQGFVPGRPSPMAPVVRRHGNLPTVSPRQQLQDMQDTLNSMHVVLKQMRAKAPAKDSLAKQNLDMWELMIKHLDKQLQDLQAMTEAHEENEARRAAMYKQADQRAAAEAQAARAANAAKLAAGASAPAATPSLAAPVAPSAAPNVPASAPAATAPSAGSTASPN